MDIYFTVFKCAHTIMSAYLVRFPKRWVEKTIVLFPRDSWSREKSSNFSGRKSLSRNGSTEEGTIPCSATGSRAALGSSNSNSPTAESVPRVCMKVRALHLELYSALEKGSTDLHSDPLLLSTTESLWWLRSCQFAKSTSYVAIFVVVLDANHVVNRVR